MEVVGSLLCEEMALEGTPWVGPTGPGFREGHSKGCTVQYSSTVTHYSN